MRKSFLEYRNYSILGECVKLQKRRFPQNKIRRVVIIIISLRMEKVHMTIGNSTSWK